MLRAARDRREAERNPLVQDRLQALLSRPAVAAQHDEIDGQARLEARVGEQQVDEFLRILPARPRLEHDAHAGILVGLVAHGVEHAQHQRLQVDLVLRERLLAFLGLRVRRAFDVLEHRARRHAERQLRDRDPPLAARQLLDGPARAHAHAAAAAVVDRANVVRARDDVAAAGQVGTRHDREQRVERDLRIANRRDDRARRLGEIVRRDVGREADADARAAVQEHHRQPRRQQLRLLERAVVVRREVDGVAVDFGEQELGHRRQPAFRVPHRGRVVAVARPEVALPVDQRISQREVLRLPHERVVRGRVAMRVVLAEHVADDARRLHVTGRRVEPELVHREQDPPLHGLLPVGDVRERASHHDAHRVLEVAALGELRERQRVVVARRRRPRRRRGGRPVGCRIGEKLAAARVDRRAGAVPCLPAWRWRWEFTGCCHVVSRGLCAAGCGYACAASAQCVNRARH